MLYCKVTYMYNPVADDVKNKRACAGSRLNGSKPIIILKVSPAGIEGHFSM